MPVQQEITIKANSIDGAAKEIIGILERTRQWDVIYVDGFLGSGLGASAILKAIVKQLRSSLSGTATSKAAGLDKIIHIDCLLWRNKRSLQKVIAEELKLPQEVMAFFDQADEDDDFDGVEEIARGVIPHVKWAILNELSNCKFLAVFHNGSGNYVDLWECGVPIMGVMSKRVLWTSGGKFLLHDDIEEGNVRKKKLVALSDATISVGPLNIANEDAINNGMICFLDAEAEEVARYSAVPEPGSSKIVLECILYKLKRRRDHMIDWGIHAANYWVCDGIIQDNNEYGRSAWEIGDALQRNMNLDWNRNFELVMKEVLGEKKWRHSVWGISFTSQDEVAAEVPTSFFAFDNKISIHGMFEQSNMSKLRVLHLSHCTFSFSSPPFLGCSNLRLLLLDHCGDQNHAPHDGEKWDCGNQDGGACFRNLWVLELSYTNWYWLLSKEMLDLMVDLKELNVKGADDRSMMCLHHCKGSKNGLLKLRVVVAAESSKADEVVKSSRVLTRSSEDDGITAGANDGDQVSSFPDLSSWYILKTIILDGCGGLEEIGYNSLPLSLESFSFTNNIATIRVKNISFQGCAKLKSQLLRGRFDSLVELDMSGTLVKTLDLSAMKARNLSRLFLLGCEKLCAILWPLEKSPIHQLKVLRIDTTQVAWAREDNYFNKKEDTSHVFMSAESATTVAVHGNDKALTYLDLYISLRDTRLFRSLVHVSSARYLHVEISSSAGHKGAIQGINNDTDYCGGGNKQQVPVVKLQKFPGNLYVDDISSTFRDKSQTIATTNGGDVVDAPAMMWMWSCPPIPTDSGCSRCYIDIQDETPITEMLQQGTRIALPYSVQDRAKTLHLHDSLSITSVPGPTPAATKTLRWVNLEWCRIERCPSLEGSVFDAPPPRDHDNNAFEYLETFWASQLQNARSIWDWSTSLFRPGEDSFSNLTFLHLEHCPRLVHVLPLYTSMDIGCYGLETLEIVCCGELREVFPVDPEVQPRQSREFPRLERIHLYELPMLHHIYRHHMLAPNLQTVKIRGCWSLKRLPAVREPSSSTTHGSGINEEEAQVLPTVNCEKELWDSLEWSGEELGHHPSHYKPCHSAYHRRTLLRASVLR